MATAMQTKKLDITHLNDVLLVLRKYQYRETNYHDLGLSLGLYVRTLGIIQGNCRGVSRCLTEVLTKWLYQADSVKSKGVPSYHTLIAALRDIGENAVADGIDKETSVAPTLTKKTGTSHDSDDRPGPRKRKHLPSTDDEESPLKKSLFTTPSSALLDARPTLDELTEHADVGVKWHQVGVQLKLSTKRLTEIDHTHKSVTDKLTAMYQLWLDTRTARGSVPVSRRQLLEVLKKPIIGQNALASDYEEWIACQITIATPTESADGVTSRSTDGESKSESGHDETDGAVSLENRLRKRKHLPSLDDEESPLKKPPLATSDPPDVPLKRYPEINKITPKEKKFNKKLVEGVKYLLVTVSDTEFRAVMGYLEADGKHGGIIKTTTKDRTKVPLYIGKYGLQKAAVVRTEEGPVNATITVGKALDTVKPKYVIAVGVCWGMDDTLKLADVLVARQICDMTRMRVGVPRTTKRDTARNEVGQRLWNMFYPGVGFQMERCGENDLVKIVTGPIIAKPDLVANERHKREIKKLVPDAIGGEMEAAGIMKAVINDTTKYTVEAIIVKGVADWGDGTKADCKKWKPFAAHAAACYVHFRMSSECYQT